jgi:[protein-PII] uridylyltransferase
MDTFREDPLFRRIRKHADSRKLSDPQTGLLQYKEFMRLEGEMLGRYHRKGDSGLRVTLARTVMMDVLLESLLQKAITVHEQEKGSIPCKVTVVALGGYGRKEMCPFSDVDIMFLYPVKVNREELESLQGTITQIVLYMLWDLGLKVGHSSRTVKEAILEAKADVQNKNAMLESRILCGSQSLYDRFRKEFHRLIKADDLKYYLEERLEDQESRRKRYGNSVLLQEPDIKNGVGGLRDYHNILWMVRLKLNQTDVEDFLRTELLTESEYNKFHSAYDFLLRVRNELHLLSSRATDLLDIEKQPKVAWGLGYRQHDIFRRVEMFMRDYYKKTRTILQISEYLMEKLSLDTKNKVTFHAVVQSRRSGSVKKIDGFELIDGVLYAANDNIFEQEPERLIRLFRHLQQFDAEIDFELVRMIRQHLGCINYQMIHSETANRAFRSILQTVGDVSRVLSLMQETGVLRKFIPEWADLDCLVQHEYYHRYTADAHTLRTIRELDKVFSGVDPEETKKYKRALRELDSPPALLYVMLLLHDIGKGESIEGHAQIGEKMAGPILDRMGVGKESQEKILFIIKSHLEMARIWQRYDIDDPRTVKTFAKTIQNTENLRYLYVLTMCDSKGTSDGLWNSYKDALHTHLYQATLTYLGEEGPMSTSHTMISKDIIREKVPELHEDEIEAHYNLMPERYFIYNSTEEVALHLSMINQLLKTISTAESMGSLVPIVNWHDDVNLSMSVVNIVTWDRAGLFYKLAGAFSIAGLSIVSSKAITRADHITIDTFYVCEPGGGVVTDKKAREKFEKHLHRALIDGEDLLPEIKKTAQASAKPSYLKKDEVLRAPIPASIDVYHELSLRRTIIEIQANDHIGLLYLIAKAIYDEGFDITFARVATERSAAVDTFYIEKVDHSEEEDGSALVSLREKLGEIIEMKF